MPELPEVEITARLLDGALRGSEVHSVLAPGINTLKTFAPPLAALGGQEMRGIRRRGKHFIIEFSEGLVLLVHLMSAGRLQLYDKHAGPRDRSSRLLVRFCDGRELRLREFGTKQAAWVKLLSATALAHDESLMRLGPEAWPEPPTDLGRRLATPRPLYAALRDQHLIAGIGRSWVDEILWSARLSPFKRGVDLSGEEVATLAGAIASSLGAALEHYERTLKLPIPDKLPMPLRIHRHQGEPCPRCATTLQAVHFEDYVIAYCPTCQTEGRVLKDRRLSRLLR
jgi:formamidopyrimidine-DNA glycosylase